MEIPVAVSGPKKLRGFFHSLALMQISFVQQMYCSFRTVFGSGHIFSLLQFPDNTVINISA